jgi:hypothetical protein
MADSPEMRREKHLQEELRNHLTILAPAILASASDRLNVVSQYVHPFYERVGA